MALMQEGGVEITPELLATRAGVSVSTIGRHFGDRAGLADAIDWRVRRELERRVDSGPFEGDAAERVEDLVHRLGTVFELTGPLLRATRRDLLPERTTRYEQRLHRLAAHAIGEALGPELAARSDETAQLLGSVVSMATWVHLRFVEDIDAPAAEERLRAIIFRVLHTSPTRHG